MFALVRSLPSFRIRDQEFFAVMSHVSLLKQGLPLFLPLFMAVGHRHSFQVGVLSQNLIPLC